VPTTLLPLLFLLALSGCITARPVALPDGRQGFAIKCLGAARDIGDCMNEAAKVCGGKYQVVTQDGVAGGALHRSAMGAFVQGIHRTLLVGCGPT
jgi:hypothetical protein